MSDGKSMMAVNSGADERLRVDVASKVLEVTVMFWVIKILATTVGETGGGAVSMTLKLGYAVASLIFLAFFIITLATQVASKRFRTAASLLTAVRMAPSRESPRAMQRRTHRALRAPPRSLHRGRSVCPSPEFRSYYLLHNPRATSRCRGNCRRTRSLRNWPS